MSENVKRSEREQKEIEARVELYSQQWEENGKIEYVDKIENLS